ncbi:MAG: hypothetical protein CMP11_08380 [Zetaproteobacteria bacterium]|nr:hypothetical protein [Pseudobdellovibrionaceae bacterium]|tara:strand:- start:278 stop:961 length:684 start_codon:yes stop_codon:yes gene_type:complete
MTEFKKEIKKTLNNKISQLNDIIADIDQLLTKMETDYYRACIFGSARIEPNSDAFKEVYQLAFELSSRNVDIVTGGGPGLMQAANMGAKDGGSKSRSIGIAIELPFEASTNAHLDVKRHHRRFSSRLDEFIRISHALIITPGGIGTLLELFYSWQLLQVNHMQKRPVFLVGGDKMWPELIDWFKKWPLKQKLISPEDLDSLIICEDIQDVIKKLEPDIQKFYQKNTK